MKVDTSGIDPDQLGRAVGQAYGLEIESVAFLPKGEASYAYVATDSGGARWLIKLQDPARRVNLEVRLKAVHYLYAVRGFTQVVAPRENRQGDCTGRYERYTLTVYPFVEGETIEPGRQTAAYASGLASLLGAFHQHGIGLPVQVPKQTFDQSREEPILRALRTVEAAEPLDNPVQERLRELMLAHRSNILATVEKMRQITTAVRQLDLDWVLTHGDPNWANLLVDRSGTLRLLDFEDVALGPPEADLVFYSDRPPERFEAFLRQYLVTRPQARLHAEVFAFGHYMWTTNEIAEYTSRILFRGAGPAEAEYALAELQPYVPAPHAEMAAAIGQIESILGRIYNVAAA